MANAHYHNVVTDLSGNSLQGASVYVYNQGTATLSTLYSDAAGATSLSNPIVTPSTGRFDFYAADGRYDITIIRADATTTTYPDIEIAAVTVSAIDDSPWITGNLNNVLYVDGVKYATLATCYAGLPSTGGVCVVPPNYTETLAASLTLSKSNSGFLFMGPATITMGSNQVIVSAGTSGVFFDGIIHNGGGDSGTGTRFLYSGTGDAFLVGSSTADTRYFTFRNIGIVVQSTGASVTGMRLRRVIYFNLENPGFTGPQATATGLVCDGTGANFCGSGNITNPFIAFFSTGILGSGSGANAMNAVRIYGGLISGIGVAGAIGLDIEAGSGNTVTGTDFSSCATAIKFGAAAVQNTVFAARNEANTTDVLALTGSIANIVQLLGNGSGNPSIVISDSGTDNHFGRAIDGKFQTLVVEGTLADTGGAVLLSNAASTGQKVIQLGNTGNSGFYFGIESSVSGAFFTGSNAYESVLYSPSNDLYIRTPNLRLSEALAISGAFSGATTGAFSGQITSTLATGTAPFSIASTTNVPNLNASSLNGATFAAPGAIGGGTPGSGVFTTLSSSGVASFGRIRSVGTSLVAGDFALDANWGAGAAVSAVTGTDQAWQMTVTAAGVPGLNPIVTLTFKDGTWTNAPICISKDNGGTGAIVDLTEVPTATTNVITFNGTPVAGLTYILTSICMGR